MLGLQVGQFWSEGVPDTGNTFANVGRPRPGDLLHTWEFKQDIGTKSA